MYRQRQKWEDYATESRRYRMDTYETMSPFGSPRWDLVLDYLGIPPWS